MNETLDKKVAVVHTVIAKCGHRDEFAALMGDKCGKCLRRESRRVNKR